MITNLKDYQKRAVDSAVEIFSYAQAQLAALGRPDAPAHARSRANVIAHHGCLLIQAPTGAGKTVIAGKLAEQFSHLPDHKIVWFWFTPFAGLVEQTRLALKETFQGLRLRDIQHERQVAGTRSGDVFVTTWASVAARNQESRKLRTDGDTALALDNFIPALRAAGFRLGVIVDEAHHSFVNATEAVRFYQEILQPEFTALITATPNDKDVERFQKLIGIERLNRFTVSRTDAVEAGLIKAGVKSIVYQASEEQLQLVDLPLAALTDGWRVHNQIKLALRESGIELTPLMLVQVPDDKKDGEKKDTERIAQARQMLLKLGIPESAIASYGADEPSDDLLAVAHDESKEVLIFKMAVALGFDAPRAFTLVSMRGARAADFGVQIVGRILRVHARLQGRSVAELLRYGYVFLTDVEKQTGLTEAGNRINNIKTEFASVSPYTMIVNYVGQPEVQIVSNGQSTFLPVSEISSATTNTSEETAKPLEAIAPVSSIQPSLGFDWVKFDETLATRSAKDATKSNGKEAAIPPGAKRFPLRPEIPRTFKTEILPLNMDGLVDCVGVTIGIDDGVFTEGFRETLKVVRKEEEIFTHAIDVGSFDAELSGREIARRAQRVLFEPDYIDPRDLHAALMKRMQRECQQRGWKRDQRELENALDKILVARPTLLKQALRACAAKHVELQDTKPLPDYVDLSANAPAARLNIYGVMPPDLNEDEKAFAELLDNDTSQTVEWWHRNTELKGWAIALVLPGGQRYFPDFMVKVRGRKRGEGLLLLEVKGAHLLNSPNTSEKVLAQHRLYQAPLMITLENNARWMTIRNDAQTGANKIDRVFDFSQLKEF